MKFTCEIDMDNAAFDDEPYELRALLAKVAERAGLANPTGIVLDSNGNRVGSWRIA